MTTVSDCPATAARVALDSKWRTVMSEPRRSKKSTKVGR
jgi:hypothetical protein